MLVTLTTFLLLHASTPARTDLSLGAPEKAKTTAEIVAAAEKEDLAGVLRKQAYVSTAEYRSRHLKAFVAWFNPYSGVAACHVYVYVFDEQQGVWERKVAAVFKDTPSVSVEVGDAVTIRDVKGKAIHRFPAE